jgi:hypothetical protein
MPSKQPKFRNRGESQHWSRVQSDQLASFNFWSKRKVNEDMAIRLCSERADKALLEYRLRVRQQ